jgi:acetylornithine deacetylase/succinyl-diaminopimelate desuccinylase-like protein
VQNPVHNVNLARLVELAQTLVAIPSVTNHEHEIADWAYEQFKAIGLTGVQRLPVEDSGDTVVGWTDGPAPGPALMLNFHLDTFPVCDGWNTDPFTPHPENGRLYGLGSHDMKGGGACVLAAVEAIVASDIELGGRLIVSATTDEENWSRGAHALIKSGLLDGCQYCLIPEPSFPVTLTVGARGRHVFHLTLRGQASHAAYDEGINAIVYAARVVASLEETDLGLNEQFGIGGSQCVIGFHGGGTLILVPQEAHVFIDRHILPGQTVEEAAAQIKAAIQKTGISSAYELTWDERPTPAPAPYLVPLDSPLVQTVRRNLEREIGRPVKLVLARSVADTNHFAVHGDIPTLVCGPQGGNTCQANEYVEIGSLPVIAKTLTQTVIDLLGTHEQFSSN